MKKFLTCMMAVLGLNSACGQSNYENVDVNGFATLIADTSDAVIKGFYLSSMWRLYS